MRVLFITFVALSFFCLSVEALCTWTYTGFDEQNRSYFKGTSGCRNYSCRVEAQDSGAVSLSKNGEEVAVKMRDMSKRPGDDCGTLYAES